MTKAFEDRFYQHKYGGIYQCKHSCVLSTVDQTEWIVYTHVWPFDVITWIRPKTQWEEEGRFREVAGTELMELFARDREMFQNEIFETKRLAKGQV